MLPTSYRDATVYCALPACRRTGRLGLGLQVQGELPCRFALSLDQAALLQELLQLHLARHHSSALVNGARLPVLHPDNEAGRPGATGWGVSFDELLRDEDINARLDENVREREMLKRLRPTVREALAQLLLAMARRLTSLMKGRA